MDWQVHLRNFLPDYLAVGSNFVVGLNYQRGCWGGEPGSVYSAKCCQKLQKDCSAAVAVVVAGQVLRGPWIV